MVGIFFGTSTSFHASTPSASLPRCSETLPIASAPSNPFENLDTALPSFSIAVKGAVGISPRSIRLFNPSARVFRFPAATPIAAPPRVMNNEPKPLIALIVANSVNALNIPSAAFWS